MTICHRLAAFLCEALFQLVPVLAGGQAIGLVGEHLDDVDDGRPPPGEPKVWFTSMKSLAEVLSDDNRALLHVIRETWPESIARLAPTTGRKRGNLSRTLKTMSRYGIVEMQRENNTVRPVVKATEFRIVAA